MAKKQYTYQTRYIAATPRNKRLTDGIESASKSGGGGMVSIPSSPRYWRLVSVDGDGNPLPEGTEHIETDYTAVSKKDFVAYGVVDEEDPGSMYPVVTDHMTTGLFRAKANGGLLYDQATGGWYVDPDMAGGGGIDEEELSRYLTNNNYITVSYLTENGYLTPQSPLTGYKIAEAYTPITKEDTILTAIGKLETNFGNYVDLTTNQTVGGVKTFTENILSQKDVVAYATSDDITTALPMADYQTTGLVRIKANGGILYDDSGIYIDPSHSGGGGVSFTPGTALELTADGTLNVLLGTTAGTACAGNDSRLHTHPNKSTLDGIDATDISHWGTAYDSSHTHGNKGVLDGITATLVGNWNSAYNDSHTHSNKSYLDTINQNLGTSYSPLFQGVKVTSRWQIDGTGSDLNIRNNGSLAAYFSGSNNGTLSITGNLIANGDVVAYATSGGISATVPVADSQTYGLVRYDNSTIKMNSSGQLYVAGGGGGGSVTVIDNLTSTSTTAALSANMGRALDQRLQNVRFEGVSTYGGTIYLGSTGYAFMRTGAVTMGGVSGGYRTISVNGVSASIATDSHTHAWSSITGRPTVISSITYSTSGSGNVVTGVTASGSTVYVTKGNVSGGSWNGGTITSGITISNSGAIGIAIRTGTPFVQFGSYWKIQAGSDLGFYYSSTQVGYFSGVNRGNMWIAGSLVQGSDMRLKDRLSDLTGALDGIMTLDVFRFTYKDRPYDRARIGLSAQQVNTRFPELVFMGSDGYYSLDYPGMVPVAIAGIKELAAIVLPMRGELETLRRRVDNLDRRTDNAYKEIFALKEGRAA